MKDTLQTSKAVPAITPAVKTAGEDGPSIDLSGFNSALITVTTGAIADSGNFGFKLQESDQSGSGFADVAAADLIGTAPVSGMTAGTAYRVGYIGKKRYVRVTTLYVSGTSIAMGGVAVLGHPNLAPVA